MFVPGSFAIFLRHERVVSDAIGFTEIVELRVESPEDIESHYRTRLALMVPIICGVAPLHVALSFIYQITVDAELLRKLATEQLVEFAAVGKMQENWFTP